MTEAKRGADPLQVAWDARVADLRRRRLDLADLKSYRQAFRNGAALTVTRAMVRGLDALPANAGGDEAMALAARTAKAALALHPEWDAAHGDCALAGSLAVLILLRLDGLPASELQRQAQDLR